MNRHLNCTVSRDGAGNALVNMLHAHQATLDILVESWQAIGAKAFSIWHNDLLLCWPESLRDALEGNDGAEATLWAPLIVNEHIVGKIGVLGLKGQRKKLRLEADAALVSQLLALETKLEGVMTERITQARLKTELDLTASIQLQLLPQKLPEVAGLDIYACSRPAAQVGGDFYKFNTHEKRPFIFAVGDVSGKGLPAALLMAMTRIVLHGVARFVPVPHPKAIISRVNEDLYDDFTEVGMFSTLFVGCYEPDKRRLSYANAGHSPVIYRAAGKSATLLKADGPAIGVLPLNPWEDTTLTFHPDDVLVVATDGFNEAHNQHGEHFGYRRLLQQTEDLAPLSAREIARTLFDNVRHFASGCDQYDDQTLIIIKGVDA